MSTESRKEDLVITRVLDAPVEAVWRAWVEPELVMQWWGPEGFTSPSAEMDVREGGVSLVCMRAPQELGGQDSYNTWTYSRIVPHERFEFVSRFSDENGVTIDPSAAGLPPDMPAEVRTLVTFKDLGEGRTEVTVTEFDWPVGQMRGMSRLGMEQCLDKMAAMLAKERQPS
jgi:uncharacterized protein YndB with AHSA1/START domain